jgi:GTPase SAR1 family protein
MAENNSGVNNIPQWQPQKNNEIDDSIKMAIVGLGRSGKTTYLASLRRKMQANLQSPLKINFANSALNYLLKQEDTICTGTFPEATMNIIPDFQMRVTRESQNLVWLFNNKKIQQDIQFRDFPGEVFDYNTELSKSNTAIVDPYINSCHGILFMIDPMHTWANPKNQSNLNLFEVQKSRYYNIISNFMEHLGDDNDNRPKEVYISFLITKIDSLIFTNPVLFDKILSLAKSGDDFELSEKLKEYADKFIFADKGISIGTIDNYYSSNKKIISQWFACSSIGWVDIDDDDFNKIDNDNFKEFYRNNLSKYPGLTLKKGKYRFPRYYPVNDLGHIYRPNERDSFGVEDPFIWLFNNIFKNFR